MTSVLLMVATDKSEKICIKKTLKKKKKNREIENTDLFFSQKVGSLYVVFC